MFIGINCSKLRMLSYFISYLRRSNAILFLYSQKSLLGTNTLSTAPTTIFSSTEPHYLPAAMDSLRHSPAWMSGQLWPCPPSKKENGREEWERVVRMELNVEHSMHKYIYIKQNAEECCVDARHDRISTVSTLCGIINECTDIPFNQHALLDVVQHSGRCDRMREREIKKKKW